MTSDRSIEEPCEVTNLTHGFGAERRGRPLRLGIKVTRNHRIFPCDEAVYKVLYLAIQNIAKEMDHAHSRLETRAKPLCHRICGALPTMSFQAVSAVVLTDSFLILLYKLSAGNRKGNTLCSLVTPGMTIWLNP